MVHYLCSVSPPPAPLDGPARARAARLPSFRSPSKNPELTRPCGPLAAMRPSISRVRRVVRALPELHRDPAPEPVHHQPERVRLAHLARLAHHARTLALAKETRITRRVRQHASSATGPAAAAGGLDQGRRVGLARGSDGCGTVVSAASASALAASAGRPVFATAQDQQGSPARGTGNTQQGDNNIHQVEEVLRSTQQQIYPPVVGRGGVARGSGRCARWEAVGRFAGGQRGYSGLGRVGQKQLVLFCRVETTSGGFEQFWTRAT